MGVTSTGPELFAARRLDEAAEGGGTLLKAGDAPVTIAGEVHYGYGSLAGPMDDPILYLQLQQEAGQSQAEQAGLRRDPTPRVSASRRMSSGVAAKLDAVSMPLSSASRLAAALSAMRPGPDRPAEAPTLRAAQSASATSAQATARGRFDASTASTAAAARAGAFDGARTATLAGPGQAARATARMLRGASAPLRDVALTVTQRGAERMASLDAAARQALTAAGYTDPAAIGALDSAAFTRITGTPDTPGAATANLKSLDAAGLTALGRQSGNPSALLAQAKRAGLDNAALVTLGTAAGLDATTVASLGKLDSASLSALSGLDARALRSLGSGVLQTLAAGGIGALDAAGIGAIAAAGGDIGRADALAGIGAGGLDAGGLGAIAAIAAGRGTTGGAVVRTADGIMGRFGASAAFVPTGTALAEGATTPAAAAAMAMLPAMGGDAAFYQFSWDAETAFLTPEQAHMGGLGLAGEHAEVRGGRVACDDDGGAGDHADAGRSEDEPGDAAGGRAVGAAARRGDPARSRHAGGQRPDRDRAGLPGTDAVRHHRPGRCPGSGRSECGGRRGRGH